MSVRALIDAGPSMAQRVRLEKAVIDSLFLMRQLYRAPRNAASGYA